MAEVQVERATGHCERADVTSHSCRIRTLSHSPSSSLIDNPEARSVGSVSCSSVPYEKMQWNIVLKWQTIMERAS